jgi:hypothetical protein
MLGKRALYLWHIVSTYMTWYMKILHPYIIVLSQGNPPRKLSCIATISVNSDMHRWLTTSHKTLIVTLLRVDRKADHEVLLLSEEVVYVVIVSIDKFFMYR